VKSFGWILAKGALTIK